MPQIRKRRMRLLLLHLPVVPIFLLLDPRQWSTWGLLVIPPSCRRSSWVPAIAEQDDRWRYYQHHHRHHPMGIPKWGLAARNQLDEESPPLDTVVATTGSTIDSSSQKKTEEVTAPTAAAATTLERRKELHEWIRQQDPLWYQEYVIDILGEGQISACQWPAVPLLNEEETEHWNDSTTAPQHLQVPGTTGTTSNTWSENEHSLQPPQDDGMTFTSQETNPTDTPEKNPVAVNITTTNKNSSSNNNTPTTVTTIATTNDSNTTSTETGVLVVGVAGGFNHDKNAGSVVESTSEKDTSKNTELSYQQLSTAVSNTVDATTKGKVVPESSSTSTTSTTTNDTKAISAKVVVYRDARDGWKMVDLEVLTSLGYLELEVAELLPDAVAIIVQNQIRRPRATLGIPAPWKGLVSSDKAAPPFLVQIVANPEEAKEWIQRLRDQDDATPRPSSKRPPTPSTVRDRTTVTRIKPPPRRPSTAMREESSIPTSTKDAGRVREVLPNNIEPDAVDRTRGNNAEDLPLKAIKSRPIVATNKNITLDTTQTTENYIPQVVAEDKISSKVTHAQDDHLESKPAAATPTAQIATSTATSSPLDTGTKQKDDDGRFVLYKDIGKSLSLVPLANLTRLGYKVEEIETLQTEALTVIIVDQVPRPSMGIPPQWRLAMPQECPEIEIVDGRDEAEARVEADKTERRRRRGVESESTRSSYRSKPLDTDPIDIKAMPTTRNQTKSSRFSQRQTREEDEDFIRRPKPSIAKESRDDTPTRPRKLVDEKGFDESRRRLRRGDSNGDGSPKRIYNARKIPNRQEKAVLSDPPVPNFWVDMDTFRDLLRSEAELRLRILGDDWAPTVKQESDWRLDLYKNWLWALHNGVGESIVPPSRYERARKTKERRLREDDEPTLSSGGRSSPRKPLPPKSGKRRSQ